MYDMVYRDGKLLAVGCSSHYATSSDGVNWTQARVLISDDPPIYASDFTGVVYAGDHFVAVGGNQIGRYTDADGWSFAVPGTDEDSISSLFFDGSRFLATGGGNGHLFASSDGVDWRPIDQSRNHYLFGIAYDGTNYVAIGAHYAQSSSNETEWSNHQDLQKWLSAVASGGVFVIVGEGARSSSPATTA